LKSFLIVALTNILKHTLRNAFSNASLRVELRRRPRIISIWIIRRQNVSTYVRRCYRNNKIGKGLERCVARVNGRWAEKEKENPPRRSIGESTNRTGSLGSTKGTRAKRGRKEERKGRKEKEEKKGRDRESYYEQRLRVRNCGISTVGIGGVCFAKLKWTAVYYKVALWCFLLRFSAGFIENAVRRGGTWIRANVGTRPPWFRKIWNSHYAVDSIPF